MKIINNLIKNIKKNVIEYSTFLISLIVFSTFVYVAYGKISSQNCPDNAAKTNSTKTVILDAGHGGEDGGAVGDEGIIEKDINLSIALKLHDYLEASGYNVIMTREKDVSIYDDNAETLREKKRSDLHNRRDIISQNEGENTIFVSIHQNKFPDPKYYGTQIFYSKNNPKSLDLANSIKESVVGFLQSENTRETKEANKKIYLLHNAQIPAVVVECGFVSNPEEAKKLSDEKYQSDMAFSICCGVMSYFTNCT